MLSYEIFFTTTFILGHYTLDLLLYVYFLF